MRAQILQHETQVGAILIALGKESMFTLSCNGIIEEEAQALADKFDWKAMQAATQKN